MGFLLRKGWKWHLADVRNRGSEAVFEKSRSTYQLGIQILSGAVANFVFLCILPFRRIVIFGIHTERVGHLSLDPQYGLLYKEAILQERSGTSIRPTLFLWLGGRKMANKLLGQLWHRSRISIISSSKFGITVHNPFIVRSPLIERLNFQQQSTVDSFLQNPSSPLHLSDREQEAARAELRELGVPESASWICILNRDQRYLNESLPGDWSYHSYRNSKIGTYQLAAEALADRGYFVLRMGTVTEEQLVSNNPRVIDYANSGKRSELLDVYLAMNCEMFVSSGTGIDSLAVLAGRPIVLVNFLPLITGLNFFLKYQPGLLAITKRFSKSDGSLWNLSELLTNNLFGLCESLSYKEADIVLKGNSPDEIKEVCLEGVARFINKRGFELSDSDLQASFWKLCREHMPEFNRRIPQVRVGEHFLSRNPQWLR